MAPRLTLLHFKRATLKIDLHLWPSLSKILDEQSIRSAAILYLGSLNAQEVAPDQDIVAVNRKGEPSRTSAIMRSIETLSCLIAAEPGQGVVVAQLDAEVPPDRPRPNPVATGA